MDFFKYSQFIIEAIVFRKKIHTERYKSVFDIDYDRYKSDVDLIIFDFDDTLVSFLQKPTEKTLTLLNELRYSGFKLAIFSNCTKKRLAELQAVLKDLSIYIVNRNNKPNPRGFSEAMEHFLTPKNRTMAVGDKLGTEIYGAYLAGIKYRILVEPFSKIQGGSKAPLWHRLARSIEKILYFFYRNFEKNQIK